MSISIAGVTKRFDNFTALDRVSLDVPGGSLLALLGPSGSGKTTLLRVIAGLEAPDEGTVRCHEEDVTFQAARERNMGFVFQHYALFRHMNVFENIAFGLRVRKVAQQEIEKRVRELLHLVRLEALERRYPNQLSGGQRQRVALARALAVRPRVLLLDEPFGALDAKVRIELRQWLRELHDQTHLTSVFVTHDQEEAFAVADQVVVMNQGRVEQIGTPQEIFEHPANPFVMDFLGNVNVFPGRVQNGRALLGGLEVEYPDHPHEHALPATGYVRPHELDLHEAPNGAPSVAGVVARIQRTGPVVRVLVESTEFGVGLNVELSPERFAELKLAAGDRVYVSPRRVRVFVPEYAI